MQLTYSLHHMLHHDRLARLTRLSLLTRPTPRATRVEAELEQQRGQRQRIFQRARLDEAELAF